MRLTDRNLYTGKAILREFPNYQEYDPIEKLACYEDTCLEPEIIHTMVKFFDSMNQIAPTMTVKRLVDIFSAEREGRLVVLPVKVGDTIYKIHNNTDACHECRNFSSFYGMDSMCDAVHIDDRYYPEVAEMPICEKQFFEIVEYTPSSDWILTHRMEFGKTVFTTKEEAEAALSKL